MSSHHIVREKQEPALLILGLNNFAGELLGQLLEWSPTVITTGGTVEKVDSLGIKIDWVITEQAGQSWQSNVKTLPSGLDSPAEAALKHLVMHNYPAVNIITDDLQLKDYLYFVNKINMVIFYDRKKIYSVQSGFSKWKPAGEIMEILTHPHQLRTEGLEALEGNCFKTTHDGFFVVQFDQPFLFIAEQL